MLIVIRLLVVLRTLIAFIIIVLIVYIVLTRFKLSLGLTGFIGLSPGLYEWGL